MAGIAGDDRLVARATHRRAAELADEIGWPAAGPVERLTITRVVNNWLAVCLLEGKANALAVGGRERAAAERSLTLAERRLHQSVRALAFVRGVPAADLLGRLTHAEVR